MSPGEIARAAYWTVLAPRYADVTIAPFAHTDALHQTAWEAAAQAVLAMQAQEETLTLDLDPDVQRGDVPRDAS